MSRTLFALFLCLCTAPAWGQYPIYPALPQPLALSAYASYSPFYQPSLSDPGFSPLGYSSYGFGYSPYGFGAVALGGVNLLPPSPPSPYYVTPSGREYLVQVRRHEAATYTQLKLQYGLQKLDAAPQNAAR